MKSIEEHIVQVIRGILFEMLLVVFAIISIFPLSGQLTSVVSDAHLAPAGVEQFGWPLAFSASYWDDTNPDKAYQLNRFEFANFALDVCIVYVIIRVLMFLGKSGIYVAARTYGFRADAYTCYVRQVITYVLLTLLAIVVVRLMYGYVTRPHINVGVPANGILTPAQ